MEDFDKDYYSLRIGVRQNLLRARTRPYVSAGLVMTRLAGERREVATIAGYQPPDGESGAFGEIGVVHRTEMFGELLMSLRVDHARLGMNRPFGSQPSGSNVSSQSILLSLGIRL